MVGGKDKPSAHIKRIIHRDIFLSRYAVAHRRRAVGLCTDYCAVGAGENIVAIDGIYIIEVAVDRIATR